MSFALLEMSAIIALKTSGSCAWLTPKFPNRKKLLYSPSFSENGMRDAVCIDLVAQEKITSVKHKASDNRSKDIFMKGNLLQM